MSGRARDGGERARDLAAEAGEEMDFHIAARADALVRDGMSPDAALARARAEFGDREAALARCVAIDARRERRRRLAEALAALRRDIRHGLRGLAAQPGFTAVAAVTLALGIGANSAIFSVVNGVLLRPLPFADEDRLVMVWHDNRRIGMRTDITSWAAFEDWRARSRAFSGMAGFTRGRVNLAGDFEPERAPRAQVGAGFFDVLGVPPAAGRVFTQDEMVPGAAPVVMIGHGLWTRRFGGAGDVLGRQLRLNGTPHEVIGVLPEGFDFPDGAQVWTPLRLSDELRQSRSAYFLYVVGRLRNDMTVARAQAEMDAIAAAQAESYPQAHAGTGIFVQPMRTHLVGDVGPALLVLLGAVVLVLLIACANVANLLLSRASRRQREMAVRLALGGGRGQLVRQLLTESLLLAGIGGVLGLALAYGGIALLRATAPADLPRLDHIGVDPVVLAFTFALAMLTGILFGLVPALQSTRGELTSALREEGRGAVGTRTGWRTRGMLVVAELSLALVLLVGAGLLVQSFLRLSRTDSGFRGRGVLTARLALTGAGYQEPAAVLAFYDRLLERLRALPGVETVAAGTEVLLEELPSSGGFTVEGAPPEAEEERIELTIDVVTPGYFRAIGTPLLLGRDLSVNDRADGTPAAVVNHAFVRRYWSNEDPLGKRFKFGRAESSNPWLTIVGVVADARRTAPDREARPSAWLPFRQLPQPAMMLLVRTGGDPLALAGAVRAAVRALDPNLPLAEVSTLDALLSARLAQRRLITLLAGIFSAVALTLALVGVYGVLSYAVAQSTREIGVRMALGAEVRDVLGMIFRRIGRLLAGGLALGLLGALVATRALGSMLYGVRALDPATFLAAPLLLAAVALLACWLPARRASRVDPAVALRAET